MKKTVIRSIAMVLCLIVALTSLVACDLFGGKAKVKKVEIPAEAVYEFSCIQNMVIENSEELADETDTFTNMYTKNHYVHYWDNNLNMFEKIDTLLCKDGKITFNHYYGLGSASFVNGGSIYSDYEETVYTLGTYSGTDVTIDKSVEENKDYTDAYLTEEGFIICVEETDSEGVVIKYEIVFKVVE